jgi:hypothetical protein
MDFWDKVVAIGGAAALMTVIAIANAHAREARRKARNRDE